MIHLYNKYGCEFYSFEPTIGETWLVIKTPENSRGHSLVNHGNSLLFYVMNENKKIDTMVNLKGQYKNIEFNNNNTITLS